MTTPPGWEPLDFNKDYRLTDTRRIIPIVLYLAVNRSDGKHIDPLLRLAGAHEDMDMVNGLLRETCHWSYDRIEPLFRLGASLLVLRDGTNNVCRFAHEYAYSSLPTKLVNLFASHPQWQDALVAGRTPFETLTTSSSPSRFNSATRCEPLLRMLDPSGIITWRAFACVSVKLANDPARRRGIRTMMGCRDLVLVVAAFLLPPRVVL